MLNYILKIKSFVLNNFEKLLRSLKICLTTFLIPQDNTSNFFVYKLNWMYYNMSKRPSGDGSAVSPWRRSPHQSSAAGRCLWDCTDDACRCWCRWARCRSATSGWCSPSSPVPHERCSRAWTAPMSQECSNWQQQNDIFE